VSARPKGRIKTSYRTWRRRNTPDLAGTAIVFFLSDYLSRLREAGALSWCQLRFTKASIPQRYWERRMIEVVW
jgi:hypothetical protein